MGSRDTEMLLRDVERLYAETSNDDDMMKNHLYGEIQRLKIELEQEREQERTQKKD